MCFKKHLDQQASVVTCAKYLKLKIEPEVLYLVMLHSIFIKPLPIFSRMKHFFRNPEKEHIQAGCPPHVMAPPSSPFAIAQLTSGYFKITSTITYYICISISYNDKVKSFSSQVFKYSNSVNKKIKSCRLLRNLILREFYVLTATQITAERNYKKGAKVGQQAWSQRS